MLIGGIILLIIAAICFFIARSQSNKLAVMNATDTYTSQMLQELYQNVSASVGADALAESCEVEGVIECDAPLRAPLTGTPCVAYTMTVAREYEEDVTETDEKGHKTTRTDKGSETVENNDNKVDFWVRDSTGRVLIRPEDADLDLKESREQFQPASGGSGKTEVDFGFFKLSVPSSHGGGRRRTLGYRATETILETGINVYVLGCASDYQGQVAIAANRRKSQKFIVSRRSERDLANSAASLSRNLYYAAAGTGVLGLLLAVLGAMN